MKSQGCSTKAHGMALELVYRAANRCKSCGAPTGAFPTPPRGRIGRGKRPKIDGFRSYPPLPTTKNLNTLLTALELSSALAAAAPKVKRAVWGAADPKDQVVPVSAK